MNTENELLETIDRITTILDQLGIPYHITGGISISVYAEPRSTQDIDIVVDPVALARVLEEFFNRLAANFFVEADQVKVALQNQGVFQLLDKTTSFKIDVYAREAVSGELSRSRRRELSPVLSANIVSLEDAIISKLLWVAKGSHRSRRDVRNLFAALDASKTEELTKTIRELGLNELLTEVINEQEPEI